jgi:chorismate mutase
MTSLHLEYPELKDYRQQIDSIDQEIARLLVARMEVVRKVGVLKRTQGENRSFIRPDREAIMLRDLMARFRETDFPESAAAGIWRIIIGASTATESPLNISVAHGHERGSAVALAREYFGPTLPCRLHDAPEHVLADMQTDPHCVGVLPADYPAGPEGPWWWQMATNPAHDIRVFARLPFVLFRREADAEPVFLAGSAAPAPSGQDVSLFALEVTGEAALPQGMRPVQTHAEGPRLRHLIEAPGWLVPDSPALAAWEQSLRETLAGTPFALYFLGAYAQPITVES